jgi:hypothetical protein
MYNTEHRLSELMQRATESLEPDTTSLVQRGMSKGLRSRRRRTAFVGAAAASAVLLTGGAAVVAAWSGGPDAGPPVAGSPGTPTSPTSPTLPTTPSPTASSRPDPGKATLDTLVRLVPDSMAVSDLEHRVNAGYVAASVTVDDGKGLSELGVFIERRRGVKDCSASETGQEACKVLADGSVLLSSELAPVYGSYPKNSKFPSGRHPSDRGVKYNSVQLHRRDGLVIGFMNYTSRDEKRSPNTRATPPFTVAQLTAMAKSSHWKSVTGRMVAPGRVPGRR